MTEVSFPGLGWTVNVDPVAFHIGSIAIYWYGLIIAAAMVLCVGLAIRQAKNNKFSSDLVYDIALVSIPSAIVGARIYYVLCEWQYYSQDLLKIFDTRSGGLAVYGGIIGAFLGAFIMLRIRKIPYSTCADYCIVYIPLGQAIGRWGNFFNQEAFGTTTTLPWGMTSQTISDYLSRNCPMLDPSLPVHPTFLYESVVDLALFFILYFVRRHSKYSYETLSVYMIIYGAARFFIEGLRTDSLYIGNTGLRTSQILSCAIVVFGLLYIAFAHWKEIKRVPLPKRFFETKDPKTEVPAEAR
ncbi:MAG: prolipoprotein diacylglyceryl transferase [Clostridiales bacterium]|nr:prolipoprotein diacylglyceryl transferase [Clostridiales bacterium]